MELIKPSGHDFMAMADVATAEAAQLLIPRYDFFQKDPWKGLETGSADCKAVALIIASIRPDLAFVKHVTKATRPSTSAATAYVHYLVLDRPSRVLVHSSGAPLVPDGAHIKAAGIADFTIGWDRVGERRAKPELALTLLERICDGSNYEEREIGGHKISMSVEDPEGYLKGGAIQDLGKAVTERLDML